MHVCWWCRRLRRTVRQEYIFQLTELFCYIPVPSFLFRGQLGWTGVWNCRKTKQRAVAEVSGFFSPNIYCSQITETVTLPKAKFEQTIKDLTFSVRWLTFQGWPGQVLHINADDCRLKQTSVLVDCKEEKRKKMCFVQWLRISTRNKPLKTDRQKDLPGWMQKELWRDELNCRLCNGQTYTSLCTETQKWGKLGSKVQCSLPQIFCSPGSRFCARKSKTATLRRELQRLQTPTQRTKWLKRKKNCFGAPGKLAAVTKEKFQISLNRNNFGAERKAMRLFTTAYQLSNKTIHSPW